MTGNVQVVQRMHAVFGAGLDLLQRLERGHTPSVENERAKLLGLIRGDGALDSDPLYVGDMMPTVGYRNTGSFGGEALDLSRRYLGVRYALAAWVDEMFIRFAPPWWAERWVSDTVEVKLFGGAQERAWRFWEQAKRAEAKGGPDALEAYLWAVMLGFRGEPEQATPPVTPNEWVDNIRRRVLQVRAVEFPMPAERDLATRVPPLRGRRRLRNMLRAAAAVVAAGLFVLAFTLIALQRGG